MVFRVLFFHTTLLLLVQQWVWGGESAAVRTTGVRRPPEYLHVPIPIWSWALPFQELLFPSIRALFESTCVREGKRFPPSPLYQCSLGFFESSFYNSFMFSLFPECSVWVFVMCETSNPQQLGTSKVYLFVQIQSPWHPQWSHLEELVQKVAAVQAGCPRMLAIPSDCTPKNQRFGVGGKPHTHPY